LKAPAGIRGRVSRRKPSSGADAQAAKREAEALQQRREAVRREQEQLRRRRDQLAKQVSQEHWDLGGLAYEMAVRDHFRLDVLVRRAALLQEHDMELADLERKLQAAGGESQAAPGGRPPGSETGAGLALAAGSLAGAAGVGGAARAATVTSAAAAGSSPPQQPPSPGETGSPKGMALRVSGPPWLWSLLLPAFLGFGVLFGWVSAGSGAPAGASPIKLVPGAASAANGAEGASSTPAASSSPEPAAESSPTAEATLTSAPATSAASASPAAAARGPRIIEEVLPASSSGTSGATGSAGATPTKLPPIRHVFVVMLSNEPYASLFGPESKASYVVHTLEGKGKLLERYYAVAHEELANEVALVSGQGPTPQTATNCPSYTAISPASAGAFGQVLGQGCVYPRSTATLGAQLAAKHLGWRVYLESMGSGAPGDPAGCQHPLLGASDPTAVPGASTPYATFRNPFLYFESVIGASTCASDNVPLTSLRTDLADEAHTPAFSYIVPDLCHDASPTPCAPGQPAGPADADSFLQSVVGEIMASKAYRKGGLLVITTDQAPATGEYADSSSCCGQPRFPNVPPLTTAAGLPRGGGEVGALLLSPYIKGGTVETSPYNSFSLLRTIEDFFGLTHLGYASLGEVSSFAPSLFTAAPSSK
jgi:phosphatidylinositol-3-phosphatase